jgi:hypothetical protein
MFVPFAEWSMLLTGNYRCMTDNGPISICDAVHADLERSREIYDVVSPLCRQRGGRHYRTGRQAQRNGLKRIAP